MKSDEYVVHSFRAHFAAYKHKNIVLYGTGPHTKIILDHYSDYPIIGLMDGFKKEGEIYGKRLLTMEESLQLKVEMIIVVAHRWNLKTIYQRIRNVCFSNQILLYGINGRNLFDLFGSGHIAEESLDYFQVSENDLSKQIDGHEVISFDVFDTLIMRKTLYPADVLDLVGSKAERMGLDLPDFKKIRKKAEIENPDPGANIYSIYRYLQILTGISDADREQLMQEEIAVEKRVIIRREKMVEMLEYAHKAGKRVFLLSDMYLPRTIMEDILAGLGIRNYEDIWVSCDYGASKGNGLFDIFKAQVKGSSFLHIGDNEHADGLSAQKSGITPFLIQSALNLLQMSSYHSVVKYLGTINDRSMVGLCISRVFNNPFCLYGTRGRPMIDNVCDAGYLFFGPIITNFMLWLIEQLEQEEYEDILFSARDGYLIQQLYDHIVGALGLKNMPEGIYFQSSRKLCTVASVECEEDIVWLAKYRSEHSPEKMMAQRFELKEDEILPYIEGYYPDVVAYALAHKDKIYARSAQIRSRYLSYMEKIGLNPGKKYALFDFCAIGTSQYFLSKIVPFDVEGLFLCRYYDNGNIVSNVKAKSLFTNLSTYNNDSYFFGQYYVFETIITSFDPSVVNMNENGEPIFAPETRSEKQLAYVEKMQEAIRNYYMDYLGCLYVKNQSINREASDMILNLMDEGYTDKDSSIFDDIYLIDDMGRGTLEIKRKSS